MTTKCGEKCDVTIQFSVWQGDWLEGKLNTELQNCREEVVCCVPENCLV